MVVDSRIEELKLTLLKLHISRDEKLQKGKEEGGGGRRGRNSKLLMMKMHENLLCLNSPLSWQYEFRNVRIDNMWTCSNETYVFQKRVDMRRRNSRSNCAWRPNSVIEEAKQKIQHNEQGEPTARYGWSNWSSKPSGKFTDCFRGIYGIYPNHRLRMKGHNT